MPPRDEEVFESDPVYEIEQERAEQRTPAQLERDARLAARAPASQKRARARHERVAREEEDYRQTFLNAKQRSTAIEFVAAPPDPPDEREAGDRTGSAIPGTGAAAERDLQQVETIERDTLMNEDDANAQQPQPADQDILGQATANWEELGARESAATWRARGEAVQQQKLQEREAARQREHMRQQAIEAEHMQQKAIEAEPLRATKRNINRDQEPEFEPDESRRRVGQRPSEEAILQGRQREEQQREERRRLAGVWRANREAIRQDAERDAASQRAATLREGAAARDSNVNAQRAARIEHDTEEERDDDARRVPPPRPVQEPLVINEDIVMGDAKLDLTVTTPHLPSVGNTTEERDDLGDLDEAGLQDLDRILAGDARTTPEAPKIKIEVPEVSLGDGAETKPDKGKGRAKESVEQKFDVKQEIERGSPDEFSANRSGVAAIEAVYGEARGEAGSSQQLQQSPLLDADDDFGLDDGFELGDDELAKLEAAKNSYIIAKAEAAEARAQQIRERYSGDRSADVLISDFYPTHPNDVPFLTHEQFAQRYGRVATENDLDERTTIVKDEKGRYQYRPSVNALSQQLAASGLNAPDGPQPVKEPVPQAIIRKSDGTIVGINGKSEDSSRTQTLHDIGKQNVLLKPRDKSHYLLGPAYDTQFKDAEASNKDFARATRQRYISQRDDLPKVLVKRADGSYAELGRFLEESRKPMSQLDMGSRDVLIRSRSGQGYLQPKVVVSLDKKDSTTYFRDIMHQTGIPLHYANALAQRPNQRIPAVMVQHEPDLFVPAGLYENGQVPPNVTPGRIFIDKPVQGGTTGNFVSLETHQKSRYSEPLTTAQNQLLGRQARAAQRPAEAAAGRSEATPTRDDSRAPSSSRTITPRAASGDPDARARRLAVITAAMGQADQARLQDASSNRATGMEVDGEGIATAQPTGRPKLEDRSRSPDLAR